MTILFAAIAVIGLQLTGQARRDQPETRLLHIDVVAVDNRGMAVTDLRRDELEVWIGGYRVPIESFVSVTPATSDQGRAIVLVLDDTIDPALMSRVRDVARRFVNRMGPGDEMAIVSLNGDIGELSTDRGRLLRSIDAYSMRALGVMRLDQMGEHVLNTMTALSRQLAERPQPRKTIVGIGAAWLFDTPIPPPNVGRDLRNEWVNAMRALAFADAHLYVVDPIGVGSSPFGGSSGFARETGGYAVVNSNDFEGAVNRIMGEAGSYYVIGVGDPPVQRNADLRELDVRPLRRGITIRARRSIPGSQ